MSIIEYVTIIMEKIMAIRISKDIDLNEQLGFNELPRLQTDDWVVEYNIEKDMPILTAMMYAHRLMRYIILKENDEKFAEKHCYTCVTLSNMFWKVIFAKHGEDKYTIKKDAGGNLVIVQNKKYYPIMIKHNNSFLQL